MPPGKPYIDPEPFFRSNGTRSDLMHTKLYQANTRHVVIKIKDCLRKGLERSNGFVSYFLLLVTLIRTAWLLKKTAGKVTKENTIHTTTHLLIDRREDFWKHHHNPCRDKMLAAMWDILISTSTDPYYEWLLRREMHEIGKAYQAGNLPVLGEPPQVLKPCWK